MGALAQGNVPEICFDVKVENTGITRDAQVVSRQLSVPFLLCTSGLVISNEEGERKWLRAWSSRPGSLKEISGQMCPECNWHSSWLCFKFQLGGSHVKIRDEDVTLSTTSPQKIHFPSKSSSARSGFHPTHCKQSSNTLPGATCPGKRSQEETGDRRIGSSPQIIWSSHQGNLGNRDRAATFRESPPRRTQGPKSERWPEKSHAAAVYLVLIQ